VIACTMPFDSGQWLVVKMSINQQGLLDWIIFSRHFSFGNVTSRKKSCGMPFSYLQSGQFLLCKH
jgi:hypothetical protein